MEQRVQQRFGRLRRLVSLINFKELPQFRVFRFGLLQDGDVGVGFQRARKF